MSNLDEKIVEVFASAIIHKRHYEPPQNSAERAIAALREAGFEIVPREPTEAMIAAGFDNRMTFGTIWTAMIRAARDE